MDDLDKKLVQALSYNARARLTDLARHLGIARTTVQSRIERLEKTGTIRVIGNLILKVLKQKLVTRLT